MKLFFQQHSTNQPNQKTQTLPDDPSARDERRRQRQAPHAQATRGRQPGLRRGTVLLDPADGPHLRVASRVEVGKRAQGLERAKTGGTVTRATVARAMHESGSFDGISGAIAAGAAER